MRLGEGNFSYFAKARTWAGDRDSHLTPLQCRAWGVQLPSSMAVHGWCLGEASIRPANAGTFLRFTVGQELQGYKFTLCQMRRLPVAPWGIMLWKHHLCDFVHQESPSIINWNNIESSKILKACWFGLQWNNLCYLLVTCPSMTSNIQPTQLSIQSLRHCRI